MLVTLNEMKTYLGIPLATTTYDAFLTEQITIVSDAIELYCNRIFASAEYVQTFYVTEDNEQSNRFYLAQYPVSAIDSVIEDDTTLDLISECLLQGPKGILERRYYPWFQSSESITVTYTAGYATTPTPIKSAVYSIVGEKYNKKVSGVDLNFGSDVQSISIPGTISIAYDYSLQANDRKTPLGMILGNYVNILDIYRSERAVAGSIGSEYVQ